MCSLPPPMVFSKASVGAAFPCGDHARKRASADVTLDLSSRASYKSSERNRLHGDGVVDATGRQEESVTLGHNKRKSVLTCWQEHDEKCKRVQLHHHVMSKHESSRQNKVGCLKESLSESVVATTKCSDKLAGAHVDGSAILDTTMELHKLERCHRSNGKQWRCTKNATPGTLYCEVHHKYRNKRRLKKSLSPAEAYCLEQKQAAFLKEKLVNAARCKRTDGKLWQCSKQAMPGSLYCESHHNRAKKKRQRSPLGATRFEAGKNKPVVVEGHVSKWKERNGLDATSVYSNIHGDGLMQLCSLVAELGVDGSAGKKKLEANRNRASMGKHEDGCSGIMTQTLPMEGVAGLVSLTDKQQQEGVEPVLPWLASPKRNKIADGLGQLTDGCISRDALWVLEEGSTSDTRHAGGSRHSDAKPQGDEGGFMRCHRNDGRQWRCSKPSKPGSSYCEHHQMFEPKAKAGKITAAEGHKLNKELRSPNEHKDRGDMDKADDCVAGLSGHNEQLQQSEQWNAIASQDAGSLKQCQRKDGKGWQCLKHAKKGLNYCPHHLEYLSRRKASSHKDRRTKNVANGLSLSSKASPAIPTITNQGFSASFSQKHSLHNLACGAADPVNETHVLQIVGSEIIPQASSSGSDNLAGSLARPLNAFGKLTHSPKAAANLQESSSVNECTVKQEVCTSVSYSPDEMGPSQIISRQERLTYVDSSTQQHQHLMLGAHDSSLHTMCIESPLKEEIKSPLEKTSAQHTLETVGSIVAGVAFDKEQTLLESEKSNGRVSQEISFLKQCQRKNGKHWQCSNDAKQGQSYCAYHLVYIKNRRHAFKLYQKASNQPGSEDNRAMCAGDGLSLCSKVYRSATPQGLQKGLSAGKPLLSDRDMLDVHGGPANPDDRYCKNFDFAEIESLPLLQPSKPQTPPKNSHSGSWDSTSKQENSADHQQPCT